MPLPILPYAPAPSPYFTPRFGAIPRLFVVHSTRSGAGGNTAAQERDGTARWFGSNPLRVSAHFIVGAGDITPVVPLEVAAHHAGEHNPYSVGVEITQPLATTPYSAGHYEAAAEVFRLVDLYLRLRGEPRIPVRLLYGPEVTGTAGITGHDRTPQGREQGKTDPGPLWDWGRFLERVRVRLRMPLPVQLG